MFSQNDMLCNNYLNYIENAACCNFFSIAKLSDIKYFQQCVKRCFENKAGDESWHASDTHYNTPVFVVMFMRAECPGFEDVRRVLIQYHHLTSAHPICWEKTSHLVWTLWILLWAQAHTEQLILLHHNCWHPPCTVNPHTAGMRQNPKGWSLNSLFFSYCNKLINNTIWVHVSFSHIM